MLLVLFPKLPNSSLFLIVKLFFSFWMKAFFYLIIFELFAGWCLLLSSFVDEHHMFLSLMEETGSWCYPFLYVWELDIFSQDGSSPKDYLWPGLKLSTIVCWGVWIFFLIIIYWTECISNIPVAIPGKERSLSAREAITRI